VIAAPPVAVGFSLVALAVCAPVAVSVVSPLPSDPPHAVTIAAMRATAARIVQNFFIVSPTFLVLTRHDLGPESVQPGSNQRRSSTMNRHSVTARNPAGSQIARTPHTSVAIAPTNAPLAKASINVP
jgi:hypothetical protein